jgi:hypothetical protein
MKLLYRAVLCAQELDAAGLLATPINYSPSPFTWQLLGKLQYPSPAVPHRGSSSPLTFKSLRALRD